MLASFVLPPLQLILCDVVKSTTKQKKKRKEKNRIPVLLISLYILIFMRLALTNAAFLYYISLESASVLVEFLVSSQPRRRLVRLSKL